MVSVEGGKKDLAPSYAPCPSSMVKYRPWVLQTDPRPKDRQ